MKEAYRQWIANNVVKPYGMCDEFTRLMVVAFPELQRVRGHYMCPVWGMRAHWWLIDDDGCLVDPTAEQFPSLGTGTYIAWEESQAEPTGVCPNCSGYCFNNDTCCSDKCGREYVAYCSSAARR